MKKLFTLCIFLFVTISTNAQNCANTSVGYPPINDLGVSSWQGAQGGLYPNGSNFRPVLHNQQGLSIATQMKPLDTAGNIDLINGTIIWLSIGMSNTTQETQVFIPMTDTMQNKNPKLKLIDGAQGGQDINAINSPNANFWNVINNRLATAGFTPKQVQVIWYKEAEAQPSDTVFVSYTDSLKKKYRNVMQIIKAKFPNAKICYLSNRIYAGYASTPLNPEPFAYYTGWTIKKLIEDQINGDASLAYSGANIKAPWLAWGPYLWADGTTPRSDGLTWICPDDYNADGTHPSALGRQKVAQLLFNFFTTDSTACPWFLSNCALVSAVRETALNGTFRIYPNPVSNELNINSEKPLHKAKIVVWNVLGQEIKTMEQVSGHTILINTAQLGKGFYSIGIYSEGKIYLEKFIKE